MPFSVFQVDIDEHGVEAPPKRVDDGDAFDKLADAWTFADRVAASHPENGYITAKNYWWAKDAHGRRMRIFVAGYL